MSGKETYKKVLTGKHRQCTRGEKIMKKRSTLLSIVLIFSLIATTIMTGCSSSSEVSTSLTYETKSESPATTAPRYTTSDSTAAECVDSGMMYYEAFDCVPAEMYKDGNPLEDYPEFNTDEYLDIKESGFKKAILSPLSTFAADVDTGSLTNLRRLLNDYGRFNCVPSGAVRTEELINYFDYETGRKVNGEKFSLRT